MNENTMRMLHRLASYHKHVLTTQSGACKASCFYCLHTFEVSEIKEWIDGEDTALCPLCGIDSVLPGVMDMADLETMRNFYFGEVFEAS